MFAEHVLRLYQVLSGDTEDAEVGLDGLLATQNLKVNRELTVFDLTVEGTLELAANLTVPEDLEVGETFDFTDSSGSFGGNVAQAFAGIADNSQDVSVASSGGNVQLTLNSNTVDQNELDAGSGPGFLLLNGGSLAWEGFRTSSEFTGDGTPGNQLGIADNAIDNAELAQMSSHSVKTGDGNGDPTDQSIAQNEVVARITGAVEGLSVPSSTFVGRTSSGNLSALPAGDAKGVLNIQASDVSADSTSNSRFQGSNSFRFRDQLIMERGALISSDAQDQTTNLTIRQNAQNANSVITFENTDSLINNNEVEATIEAEWSNFAFEGIYVDSPGEIEFTPDSNFSVITNGSFAFIELDAQNSDVLLTSGEDTEITGISGVDITAGSSSSTGVDMNLNAAGDITLNPSSQTGTYSLHINANNIGFSGSGDKWEFDSQGYLYIPITDVNPAPTKTGFVTVWAEEEGSGDDAKLHFRTNDGRQDSIDIS